jgi:hypothetical protein
MQVILLQNEPSPPPFLAGRQALRVENDLRGIRDIEFVMARGE